MLHTLSIIAIIEVIIVVLPFLLNVAFVTVAERKTMASMQRRLGPNAVGYLGLLQAFADALKLLLKEYVAPTQANIGLFFLGPIITLIFSLLGYAVIPLAPGLSIFDFSLGILFLLAVSSLSTYGILIAGWSANSKYAFLGSLRSTAQLISYELVLSSAILLIIFLTSSLNLTANIEVQRSVLFFMPLLPTLIIFFIGAIAETNRAPFDLAEAESELVSGFMTEHSSVIFVFFFLAEYASIILICILTCVLYFGGYTINLDVLLQSLTNYTSNVTLYYEYISNTIINYTYMLTRVTYNAFFFDIINLQSTSFVDSLLQDTIYSLSLGLKACVIIFVAIWIRASFPRIRFDQLMTMCWTGLLPLIFAFILILPCVIYTLGIIPNNILFK